MGIINAFRKKKLENLKNELVLLKEKDGCYRIPCSKCPYLYYIRDKGRYTCKRERIVKEIRKLEKEIGE